MKVIFFKKDVGFVLENISDDSCAFWYSPGLSSYKNIESIVDITEIIIEDSIFGSFIEDYGYLLNKFEHRTFESETVNATSHNKTCVYASNDTHIYLFKNILANLESKWKLYCRSTESAPKAAERVGLLAFPEDHAINDVSEYSTLLMSNDWGPLEQNINLSFLRKGINTICLQESVIDFNLKDKRMLQCSLPVFQGIVTLKHVELRHKICAVIGNPRYEKLLPSPMPREKKVLINVNFTYGIYEDQRQVWVDDIVSACKKSAIDYVIIQHPRDRGNFDGYNVTKTNAGNVHAELIKSSILITRFSSLIHEALCLGRPVIYYNPHGEQQFYDFEPDNKCLYYAKTADDLHKSIQAITRMNTLDDFSVNVETYLQRHLGVTYVDEASKFVSALIRDANGYPPIKKVNIAMIVYNLIKGFKRKLLRQKF